MAEEAEGKGVQSVAAGKAGSSGAELVALRERASAAAKEGEAAKGEAAAKAAASEAAAEQAAKDAKARDRAEKDAVAAASKAEEAKAAAAKAAAGGGGGGGGEIEWVTKNDKWVSCSQCKAKVRSDLLD